MRLKWVVIILVVSLGIFLVGFGSFKLTQKERAGLQVMTGSKPVGVFLDDHYLDRTPLIERNLKPGTYTVRLEPEDENLASYDTEVTLHPGTLTIITWNPGKTVETSGGVIYEMKKLKNNKTKTVINFISIPDKAIIKVDNRPTDFTPLLLEDLDPGKHRYEVSLPAYETQQHSLNLKKGYQVDAIIKLAKLLDTDEVEKPTPTQTPQPTESTSSAQLTILKTGLVQAGVEVLRVREKPSKTAKQIGVVYSGKKYPYLKEKDGWYQIKFGENLQNIGWISAKYAKKDL